MKRIIREQRLGFVATVDPDGTPNLSPKGTMVVLDDDHIAFGEIRSPNTIRNLRNTPELEINFVDPFARKGYRFKGTAEIIGLEDPGFRMLFPEFAQWGELSNRIRAVVKIHVERALPLTTPAYDIGMTEAQLRETWTKHFQDIQPK
jgi:uncharacterized protein